MIVELLHDMKPDARADEAARQRFVSGLRSFVPSGGTGALGGDRLGPHGVTVNNVCPHHVTTGLGTWQNAYFAKVTGHDSCEVSRIPVREPLCPLALESLSVMTPNTAAQV